MRDGTMFAGLKNLRDEKVFNHCPYFWILTPGSDKLYKICSIFRASSGSGIYRLHFKDFSEFEAWKSEMISLSDPDLGGVSPGGQTVTLSSCTGDPAKRIVVLGSLIWESGT